LDKQPALEATVQGSSEKAFVLRLLLKTLGLFLLINLVFAWVDPVPTLGRFSLYNHLFPGRTRLPYSDDPTLSYSLTVNQLDAMFASHVILDSPKSESEYRVILVGDSSVWGYLQRHEDTISQQLNGKKLRTVDGRDVQFYNLGYPTLSLTKDLLILDYASKFQPDLILWFITLESLPVEKQLQSPVLTLNPQATQTLLAKTALGFDEQEDSLSKAGFWERTIVGRRRLLADLIRHQIYGLMWSATQIDQYIPPTYDLRAEDLSDDVSYQDMSPEQFSSSSLAFNVIKAGMAITEAQVILVNEPIFISAGENSDVRYNFYYPIWAYDQYQTMLEEQAEINHWDLINLWDLLPGEVFTDSAIHYNLDGVEIVSSALLSSPQLAFMGQ
jgi:hypothetical protein